jgi:hypothetical protein
MKFVLLSDIHFGCKNNSQEFNQQCLDFLQFVGDYCSENLNEEFYTIFMGDWNHVRPTTNNLTLKYSTEGIYALSNIGGSKTFMIVGNHDLYYKDSRLVSSIIIPSNDLGVELIDEPIKVGNLLLCPWLVGNESLKELILTHSPEYVFGHFEIPSFSLNKKVKFPGEFNPYEYYGPKRIFSGHFHCFSENANITYIGNCFSHDFSDANDWNNKGFLIFDTDTNEYERVVWDKAPKYMTLNLSDIDNIEILPNMHLRITNDTNISIDDVNKIQEKMLENEMIKECHILPKELELSNDIESIEISDIGNMNSIIPELLTKIEMDNINTDKLITIYNKLEI